MKIHFFVLLTVVLIPLYSPFAFKPAEASDFNTGNLTANSSGFSGNRSMQPQAETLDFIEGNATANPSDLSSCKTEYSATACDMAKDLISLSKDEIGRYGLSDNPNFVIEQTLNSLDPGNLTKVLQNISPQELISIKDKLTPQIFDTILSKVPEPEHSEIVSRASVHP